MAEDAIKMEEISVKNISEFWEKHYEYLIQDGLVVSEWEKQYFQSRQYRQLIEDHMKRETDPHHLVYFVQGRKRIGACSYCIYHSEDGKCLIADFWIFPQFRRQGKGHRCFEALRQDTSAKGAIYYEINCDGRPDRTRFWKSNQFQENGTDEYGIQLMLRH